MTGWGIARRELLRFTRLRERFLAALVRPLVWLFIFAAGFRSVLALRTLRGRGFVLSVEGGEA